LKSGARFSLKALTPSFDRRIVEQLHGMKGHVADAGMLSESALKERFARAIAVVTLRELVGPSLTAASRSAAGTTYVDQAHFTGLFGGVTVVDEPDSRAFCRRRERGGNAVPQPASTEPTFGPTCPN